jgi:hypothetical protein
MEGQEILLRFLNTQNLFIEEIPLDNNSSSSHLQSKEETHSEAAGKEEHIPCQILNMR